MGRCDFENFNVLICITKLIIFKTKFLASEIFLFPNERSHPFCASANRASTKRYFGFCQMGEWFLYVNREVRQYDVNDINL